MTTHTAEPALIRMTRNAAPGTPARAEAAGRLLEAAIRELRNPVATMVAAGQMLDEELGAQHRCAGFARLIRQESLRIQEALADLSAMAMPLPLAMRAVDLKPLVSAVLAEVASEHPRVHLEACLPVHPPTVRGDAAGLRVALRKLLGHQAAALPCGGTIRVEMTPEEDCIRLALTDNGPDAPEEALDGLFSPFGTAPGRRPELGLAVCRKIVEQLGGAVAARRAPGGGVTFVVRLPRS